MSGIKLAQPVVAVVLEQPDGQLVELTVQTDNRDSIQWDVSRGKRNWPAGPDAPVLWLSFISWHALKRTGATALQLDEYLQCAVQVRTVKAVDDLEPATADEELVGPTLPAHEAG